MMDWVMAGALLIVIVAVLVLLRNRERGGR